ncbi:putative acetyltransferase [Bacillus sp. TS-2]|nr:putative acetyltransferase [Bacillus sp. TS-2]
MLQTTKSKVTLRKVAHTDVDTYHKWRNDLEVMNSTSLSLDVYSLEETKDFFEQVILNGNHSKSYIIEETEGNNPIGITSLINIDSKNRNAEFIIDIGEKEYWGQGIATIVLKKILDFAFFELNLHKVYLKVFSYNEKAVHLYTKLGFEQEGANREALFRGNRWHDIVHMGILKKEWELNNESRALTN